MIYIDPPYNTGKDFVYRDDYRDGVASYLEWSNQVNETGKTSSNAESTGRYHSNWLNMMYPRLKLARNLLKDDGVIFISIDDDEVANIRKVADEIFGESNFIANAIWEKKYTRANDARWFSDNHDHILIYARYKNETSFNLLPRDESQLKAYANPDNHPKGPWKSTPLHAKSGTNTSSYTFRNGITWTPPVGTYRRFNDDSMDAMDSNREIWFGNDGSQTPSRKSFLSEVKNGVTPVTLWGYKEVGHNHEANNELKNLGIGGIFDNPKPTRLIKRIIDLATREGDTILDFFAGSGTTGHATLSANLSTKIKRNFILVQLPEPTNEKSTARTLGFKSIPEVSRRRIILFGDTVKNQEVDILDGTSDELDIGFRSYKLIDTNFTKWRVQADASEGELQDLFENLKDSADDNATPEALFTEVLLKLGFSLTEQYKTETINGLEVFSMADRSVIGYFNEHVTPTLNQLRSLVDACGWRLLILEDSFNGDDELKANLVQLCSSRGIELAIA